MKDIKKNEKERYLKKAKKLYEKAVKEKDKNQELLSECLELSFPSNDRLNSTLTKDSSMEDKTVSQYDDTVKIASRRMVNYIADTLTPAGQLWAYFDINVKYDGENETQDADQSKAVRTVGNVVTDAVFKEINDSNAHNPLYQSYENFVGGGTGAVKLLEMPPFSKRATQTKNLPLDRLYYLEDTFEFPEFVMYKHIEEDIQMLYDLFGKTRVILDPAMEMLTEEQRENEEYNFIEGCILLEHKQASDEYLHFMTNENFDHFYFTEILDYNPFTVYRWSRPSDNHVWGVPISMSMVANIRTLNESVELEMKKSRLMLNPPMAGVMEPSYMPFMDAETMSSQVRYEAGKITFMNGVTQIYPIITSYDMQMSAVNSEQIRNTIYSMYNVNPLGDVQNTRYRTAEEMALRHQEFSKQFAPTYGRMMNEFMGPYLRKLAKILQKRNRIPLDADQKKLIKDSEIVYVNPLTKLAAQEEIQNAINFKMMMSKVLDPEIFQVLFDDIEFAFDAATKLNIAAKVLNDKEEVIKGLEQLQAQKQAMMQQAMMQQGMPQQQGAGPEQGGGVIG